MNYWRPRSRCSLAFVFLSLLWVSVFDQQAREYKPILKDRIMAAGTVELPVLHISTDQASNVIWRLTLLNQVKAQTKNDVLVYLRTLFRVDTAVGRGVIVSADREMPVKELDCVLACLSELDCDFVILNGLLIGEFWTRKRDGADSMACETGREGSGVHKPAPNKPPHESPRP